MVDENLKKNPEKRILHITVRSDIGGGPKHLNDLSRTLSEKFNCFQIIAAPKDTFFNSYKEIAQDVIEIPHRRFSFSKLLQIRKVIREKNINIIHSHGRGAGIYSRLLSYITKAKIIHTFHGVHQVKTIMGFVKDLFDKMFSHRIHHFICVSPDEQKKARNALYLNDNSDSSIVFNGVDTEKFTSIQMNKKERGGLTFGTLCRFNFQKGIDISLDFIEKYQDFFRENNFTYIIQGDGESFLEIKKDIEKKELLDIIKLPGATNDPLSFFKNIDIYLSFSRWEGFPLSVIEAMASGKPCLLSDVPGHQTFIENELCLKFNLNSNREFYNQIEVIKTERHQTNEIANKAIRYILENLTLEKMSNETQKIYNRVIGS